MRQLLFRITLALAVTACALALSRGPLGPQAAWAASPALTDAQQLYDGAHFNDAITKLRDALSTGAVTGPDALKAKELLGRCLVKSGSRVEAKEQFKNLLRQDSGYRLEAVSVPPDEMEVFNLALKEIQAEQIEAGHRIPASLGFYFAKGSGDNKSLGEVVSQFGGPDKLDAKSEFGGSVRFPIHPRFSLDLELSRLRATGKDTTAAPGDTKFEAAAIPLVVSLYWTAVPGEKFRGYVFAGAGPLLAASNSIDLPFFSVRIQIADTKTGFYFHTGAEGEYMLHRKVSLTGRVLYRSATASNLYHSSTVEFSTGHPLKDRKVDFSGFQAAIGLRAYIGY